MTGIRLVVVLACLALVAVCNARSAEKEEALSQLKQLLLRRLVNGEARAGTTPFSVDGRTDDGVDDALAKLIVDQHNDLRVKEKGSNMHRLRWDPKLAQLAQEWANRCAFEHRQDGSFDPNSYGFPSVGENIWAHSTDTQIPDKLIMAIMGWYNEKENYTYDSATCKQGQMCGHYTQVVGANTVTVGCGFKKCPTVTFPTKPGKSPYTNGFFFVCNYGPYWGSGKPYKKGSACTECETGKFFCSGDLCDATCTSEGSDSCQCKASCKMCSTKTPECTCKCRPGFMGVTCIDRCEDKNEKCGKSPGYPQQTCTGELGGAAFMEIANKECPKMCKQCLPFDGQPCTQRDDLESLDTAEIEFLINELENSVDRK